MLSKHVRFMPINKCNIFCQISTFMSFYACNLHVNERFVKNFGCEFLLEFLIVLIVLYVKRSTVRNGYKSVQLAFLLRICQRAITHT